MGKVGLISDDGTITDPYRNFIAVSRYARWRDDLGRRETWTETVTRYVDFFRKHLSTRHDYDPNATIFDEVHAAIVNHEIMPSMRALMTAGPALERSHIAGYNCFRATEKFMTRSGLRTFAQAAEDDDAVVLNAKGEWVPAEIKEFGVQTLQRVSFRPGHQSKTTLRHFVDVTPDHRWITTNRGEVTDLRVGDEVAFVGVRQDNFHREAWIAGFGFGDGTINQRGQAQIRLCGNKNQFLDIFAYDGPEQARPTVSTPPSYNGDHALTFPRDTFDTWKTLPTVWQQRDPEYLASWIYGYIAADGSDKGDGLFELSSQDDDAIHFVKKYAPYAGLMVVGHNISSSTETNYGPRSAPLQKLTLRKNGVFRVARIEEMDVEEPVYCAVVPDGHEFVLANGIHTGNCSFIAVDSPRAFDEAMYVLMNGTGVGFSVEARYVDKLPPVPAELVHAGHTITVEDSKEGWATAFSFLLQELWHGFQPDWDLSLVRPAGTKLKTFGGRASGPDPLERLFQFTVDTFLMARGRQLSPIEAHDLMCMVGDVVVSGGVRRSALISLSDLDDPKMAAAKSGAWWEDNGHRRLANNTAVYHETPSATAFKQEWQNLVESGSGERGIFNMAGVRAHADAQGRDGQQIAGTNPCAEILLRANEFCNLTEVIIRPEDSVQDVNHKVHLATIMGTWQSTLVDFQHLRPEWSANCREERLLGVSLTGIYGHASYRNPYDPALPGRLAFMRKTAYLANLVEAALLKVPKSAAITCVKPSGTVSQLTGVSSGIHPWHAPHYLRTVRGSNSDPLTRMLSEYNVPHEPDLMDPDVTTVFSFPIAAPTGAVTREQITALDHLRLWSVYRENWSDHNPSVTISVRSHEWDEVGEWVYANWDRVGGISFLPYSEHTYQQAPYTDCDQDTYDRVKVEMPTIHWADLSFYEDVDTTTGSQELACTAGACDVVDIKSAAPAIPILARLSA